ncbi:MAG TPA: hypothetical protein VKA27_03210, partial [Sunxiuqinia sp.]|nr:hypothetical protein [Sunxiuqinia sp.]
MKKLLLGFLFLTIVAFHANAQAYETGIGLRGGFSNGLTVKHFISETNALEGILSTRWRGFNVTGLYEVHQSPFAVEELSWYYGGGGHIGFWDGSYASWAHDNSSYTVIGIDGILGLEYSFAEVPFC